MSPVVSTARLPTQRYSVVSGAWNPCWTGAPAMTPPVTSSWAHCGRVLEPPVGRAVLSTQTDSWLPTFRYCTFCMRRDPRLSRTRVVLGWGTMFDETPPVL